MAVSFIAPIEDIDTNWRYETKYRISLLEYFAIRNALAPYMKRDHFTRNAPFQKYLVRSLYFDTMDYRMYIEKINGDCNRIKFRIRTYGKKTEDNPDIRVEMKVRKGNIMEKYGSFISFHQYQTFINSGYWNLNDDPVLVEFERYTHKWNLVPKTLVQYYREGFHSRAQEAVRLTFDHQIMSTSSRILFPEKCYWRQHCKSQVVLEIKHRNEIPNWISNMVQNFHLRIIPNSKYAHSIEIAPKDIIFH